MPEMSDATSLLSHTGWIRALASHLTADAEQAEDAAQETWVTALEKPPETDRPVRGWLATVLRNHLGKQRLREANRRDRERQAARGESTASTFDLVARATTQKELVAAVLELDEPYRETILLRFFEDLSYREVARRGGVSVATVNSRITRGLQRLRERLDGRYGDRQAWLFAFGPLLQTPKGWIALSSGALTMTTVTQISLLAVASTAAVLSWPSGAGASIGADPSPLAPAPSMRLAGQAAPEGFALTTPAEVHAGRVTGTFSPGIPVELRAPEPFRAAAEDTWSVDLSHEHPLAASVERLTVNAGAGDVTIVRGEGANVRIEAGVRADLERIDARQLTSAFEDHVLVTEMDGTLEIGDAHEKRGEQGWSVSLTVHLPRAMDVLANSGAGDVTVRHASGALTLNSGAGNVTLAVPQQEVEAVSANSGAGNVRLDVGGLRGALSGNSGAGDVSAHLARTIGSPEVSLNSGVGSVTLTLPSNVSGRFELETGTGSVTVPASLGLQVTRKGVGESAEGSVGAEGGRFRLQSGAGAVRLALE